MSIENSQGYRLEIDGLRAIAVMSVLVFHGFPGVMDGGYLGVDIFFVISGFLISDIIFKNLNRSKFSIIDFYYRRILRIFPALTVVLLTCAVMGYLFLFSNEYALLGKHILGAGTFISNIVIWFEAGYFDTVSEAKPLLHLWSLGVEEQFYLFYPLLAWAIWKLRLNYLRIVTLLLAASFLLCLYMTDKNPTAAFFNPVTRVWELMTGCLLSYMFFSHRNDDETRLNPLTRFLISDNPVLENIRSAAGLSLIIGSLFLINDEIVFPGWYPLPSVIGTALMLSSCGNGPVNRLMRFSPFVLIGKISYPMYLWHWLFFSFINITAKDIPTSIRVYAAVFVILVSWLTYELIEKPFRFYFKDYKKMKMLILISLMVLITVYGAYVYLNKGFDGRTISFQNAVYETGRDGGYNGYAKEECGISGEQKNAVPVCVSDNRGTAKYMLVGDSKAMALISGLIRTSDERGRWVFIGGTKGNTVSVPVLSDEPAFSRGQEVARIALDSIKNNKNIEVVAIASATRELFLLKKNNTLEELQNTNNFDMAKEALGRYVSEILSYGKSVVLVVDNPTLDDPKYCVNRLSDFPVLRNIAEMGLSGNCRVPMAKQLEYSAVYRKMLNEIAALNPEKVKIFDTVPLLCDEKSGDCLPYRDGRYLYEYSDHISDYGAGIVGRELNSFINGIR